MNSKQTTVKKVKLDSAYIHDYDRILTRQHNRIRTTLPESNGQILLDYDVNAVNQAIGKANRIKHLQVMLQLSVMFDNKPWKEITKSDVETVIAAIMDKYSSKGDETHATYDFKKVIKIFFRWLHLGHRKHKVCLKKYRVGDPQITEDIVSGRVADKIVREDLITSDTKSRLLHACGENLRDRAMIDVGLEAGTRSGELLTIQLKHVKSDEYGATIAVDGKTGARPIRIIESAPNLFAWINAHPFRDNPDAPLCINLGSRDYGEPLKYPAVRSMLKRICKKAEINRRIYLTLFRHTEATKSANYLTEAQMKKRHGWSNSSNMQARYVHLVDADVDDAILRHHGIKKKKEIEEAQLPKICLICKNPNAWDSNLCSNCGKPLDLKIAIEHEEKEKQEKEQYQNKVSKLEQDMDEVKAMLRRNEEIKKSKEN